MASCTFPEALFARILTETTCNTPVRDRSVRFNILNITLGAVTTVVVFIRVMFKRCFSMRQRLGADDWVIAVALVLFGLPSIATMIFGLTAHGLGKDIWGLQPADLTAFARYFYIMEILYLILMTLIKLTLSLFYLDIFCGKIVRRLLWGMVVFHIAFGIAFVVKVIFQCSPISFYWRKFDISQAPDGHCIDINASGWANAAIGVAVDFWLIAIPLSQVKKLNLHWKKKVGAALMFLTGAL
ncbi:hypothetical protein TOPH_05819 [Tolypocladium ophioglossoides CBS 100239]|uniref:Rhodopsin domain-containing protein n=1 Tax=Tolypocladium ophioglossoides (strain CBS 100239) TaxID=1163406 RepID=A0A0L0N608_TOLOC|nr:hypothetical protein TOPH_05819 [Tolypocladium ophioglossoides CBS 100239]